VRQAEDPVVALGVTSRRQAVRLSGIAPGNLGD
jgi:hypothetical protein